MMKGIWLVGSNTDFNGRACTKLWNTKNVHETMYLKRVCERRSAPKKIPSFIVAYRFRSFQMLYYSLDKRFSYFSQPHILSLIFHLYRWSGKRDPFSFFVTVKIRKYRMA